MADEPKERRSMIIRGISRNIQTAPFHQVEVWSEIREEITWTTLQERQTKSDNWTELMLLDFDRQIARACKKYNLEPQQFFEYVTEPSTPLPKEKTWTDEDYDSFDAGLFETKNESTNTK